MTAPIAAPAPMPRELVLASAGTGKTFRISSRIIGLLAAGSRADAIFASTFTRKAAGEILDRVLARLAGAALDPSQAEALAQDAALAPGSLAGWTEASWLALLRRVIADLHRLNIGTLDAFFIRAASSFADEVALPPGWGIADRATAEAVRAEALASLLREGDPGELMELVREIGGKDAARSVHGALLERAEKQLALHYALDPAAADAWSGFDHLAAAVPADLARRQEALAAAFAAAEPARNVNDTPNATWTKALLKISQLLTDGAWDELVCEKLLTSAREPDGMFARHAVTEEVAALASEVFDLARAVLGRRFAAQSHAMRRVGEHLASTVAATQRERGVYEFGDVTRLLGGEHPLCQRPDLYYRLDARIRHVLLDEFQDTSLAQWEALQPMLDGLLTRPEEAGAAVVVADPKQSIYGWRGGEPLLVRHVGERYRLTADQLSKSWRSSPVVLDLVNRVFSGIDENPVLAADALARATASDWKQMFTEQVAARPELRGHVRMMVGPDDATRGNDRPLLCRRAARLVAELRAEAPDRSIGVLTRNNQAVARMMLELRELGVAASEEGGNPLTDSAAVSAVVSLLRMADHPGDRVARYHVAKTPLGALYGLADHRDGAGARRVARRVRARLLEVGYGRTLQEIEREIGPACEPRDRRRLGQLVELGHRYDARATLRTTDFVRVVETEKMYDPTEAAVRVMTVHQAKGLEFDIVVLPELDLSMVKTATDPLTYRPGPADRVTRVFPYVKSDLRALFPEVTELHLAADQAAAAQWRDALSGLYVALTRARHAVHIVLKADGASGPGKATSAARLIRSALGAEREAVEGETLFESGDPLWYRSPDLVAEREGTPSRSEGEERVEAVALRAGGSLRGKSFPRVTPSSLAGGTLVDLRSLLRLERGAADRGTLVHAWLERVGWLEDGEPTDGELREIARSIVPGRDAEEVERDRDHFRSWLRTAAIRRHLLRASYPPGATVEREVPFLHRSEGRLVEGVIDRLTLIREDGVVVRAEILDYKTDSLPAGDADARGRRVAEYRPQLEAYRAAVRGWYSLPPEAVEARLVFLDSALVVEV